MKLNDYVVKSSLEEVAHSSGYAKAQSGGSIGAASAQSFSQRQSIDYRNSKVRSYQDSQLGQLRMAQKINIKLSLNFFREIVKIFLISAIIYYLPIASVQLGKFFYIF